MNEGIELEVYSYNDPKGEPLDVLNGRVAPTFLDEITGNGGSSFKVSVSDPKVVANPLLLAMRNVVRVRVNGDVVGAMIISGKKVTTISDVETQGEYYEITGETLKTWPDDAVVMPHGGLKRESPDSRTFSFATERGDWYVESDWITPVEIYHRNPTGWPSRNKAKWLWGESLDNGSSPPNTTCLFRYEFNITTPGSYVLYVAIDDYPMVYMDGVEIVKTDYKTSAWEKPTKVELTLSEGSHIFAASVQNKVHPNGPNPGALIATLYRRVGESERHVWSSKASGWEVMKYPDHIPAWSPGEIMVTLLDEAQARGVEFPNWLTPTFTSKKDSHGVDWVNPLTWTFPIGESLSKVIGKFEELGIYVWIDPENLELNMAYERGVDRSDYIYKSDGISVELSPIVFERGKNLRRADSESRGKIKNTLAVKTEEGWLTEDYSDQPSASKYGTLESMLDTGSSASVSKKLAQVVFAQKAEAEEGATYDVLIFQDEDTVPFRDFQVGDWVLAPNELDILVKRRVMSISLTESDAGLPLYTIEFDTIFEDNEARLNKIISKQTSGVGGGFVNANGGSTDISAPVIVTPGGAPKLLPLAPIGLQITSEGKWDADGVSAFSEVHLTWQPVTQNTDGSETVPSYYEIWGHLSSASDDSYMMYGIATGTEALIRPFQPSSEWTFRIRAMNDSDSPSEYSAEVDHTMATPDDPMVAPSAPMLSSNKGVLIVEWDGKLENGLEPPPQFRYIYALVSDNEVGPFVKKGPALMKNNRDISITGLNIGGTYWVKLIGVDGVGLESPESTATSEVITGIDLGDLDQQITDAIDAANTAAEEAKGIADTASNKAQDALDEVNRVTEEVISRGNDLITNRTGLLEDNTNFSSFTFVQGDVPTGMVGAFRAPPARTGYWADEVIPVDPSKHYACSVWARQATEGLASTFYYAINPIDADGLSISPSFYMEQAGTRTTLAAPLNPGDTTITLTSAANWNNAGQTYQRSLLIWDYVDGNGKLWSAGEYSRRYFTDAYAPGGISGNVITLRTPWTGLASAAGTEISNGNAGGAYIYPLSNVAMSNEWKLYIGATVGGIHTDNTKSATTKFPIATAQVQVGVLANYGMTDTTDSKQLFTGLSFSDVTAIGEIAQEALTTASGKNSIVDATVDATGTGTKEGDWWRKWDSLGTDGNLLASWRWDGTQWVKEALDETYLPLVNIGEGTYGSLNGDRMVARSIVASKLTVTDWSNLIDDPDFRTNLGSLPTGSAVISPELPYSWNYLDDPTSGSWEYADTTDGPGRALKLTSGTTISAIANSVYITARENDQFNFSLRAQNSSDQVFSFQVYELTDSGGSVQVMSAIEVAPQTPWEDYSVTYTVQNADTHFIRPLFVDTLADGATAYVSGQNTWISNPRIRRMNNAELIVDGAITSEKILAEAVHAEHVAAGAIATIHLQADAVTTEVLAVGSVTANALAADAVTANAVAAGAIQTSHLSPDVGDSLDISANDTVTIIAGQLDGVEADAQATAEDLGVMQTYYQFGPDGAVISKPDSPFALALRSDSIAMLENGNVVSYWNSGQMIVSSFVGEEVILGNHKLEKYGDGTVVRAL